MDIADTYSSRAAEYSAQARTLAARSRLVSNLRGLAFGVAAVAGLFAAFGKHHALAGGIAAVGAVAFLALVTWHSRVIEAEDDAKRWERVNRDALARVTGEWRGLPEDGRRFRDDKHPYLEDLDVFGPGSLFQRISVAHTRFGQQALARYLRAPAEPAEIRLRQEAARALAPELGTRQRLEALALAVAEPTAPPGYATSEDDEDKPKKHRPLRAPPDPEPLLAWAESEPELAGQTWLAGLAWLLPPMTIAGMVAAWGFGLPTVLWGAPLLLQVVLTLRAGKAAHKVFTAVSSTEGAFLRYGAMLELIERLDVPSELIGAMQKQLMAGEQRPSHSMKEFRKKVGWFDIRHNGFAYIFVNPLFMWDVHCVLALEKWQKRSGKATRGWFRALGEVEALSSLAGLSHDEPGYAFAEIAEDGAVFEAEGLGHPLIDDAARVVNDVTLPAPGTALLVTGSNMSGKSTLLRSMGLSTVMALAGAPSCAVRLRVARFSVCTSIRIADSLGSGVSHFYAELNKLKAVLDATNGEAPVLFLLDEILHGTNSRERQIGARWVISELLSRGAMGAVSTHDMGLARLPDEMMAHVTLVHFRESVDSGKMSFDFKIRPGPVTAGNALRLMRTVGLEVPLEQ